MIFDVLNKIERYSKSIPSLNLLLKFMNNRDLLNLTEGDIWIDGRNLYVKILRYYPKKVCENNFEIHRIYTDVQVVLKGVEKIQVVNRDNLQEVTEYNESEDYQFFSAQEDISDIIVKDNNFVVFFPGQAHKPGCIYENLSEPILKLVFKIRGKPFIAEEGYGKN